MITIFVVDDHLYLNLGLAAALAQYSDEIKVIGSANSGKDALKQLSKLSVDIVLLDIVMPEMDGITCCKHIKEKFPETKVIGITGELNPDILLKMWRQKADGLLVKTCGVDELVSVIKKVLKGRRIIGNDVPAFFSVIEKENEIPSLTKTELKVLKLLGEGLTRQEAADKLFRSVQSVDFHCRNIFSKFKSNRIHTILAEAKKARIIS